MTVLQHESPVAEVLTRFRDGASKTLAGFSLNHLSRDEHSLTAEAIVQRLPEKGPTHVAFGPLVEMYAEAADTTELDPITERIAHQAAEHIALWEKELQGATINPALTVVRRKDIIDAIELWAAHPSDDTEAAVRTMLSYSNTHPKTRNMAWNRSYEAAFDKMFTAYATPGADKMFLSSALDQVADENYDSALETLHEAKPSDYRFLYENRPGDRAVTRKH